jgi:hypothetical protein
MPEEESIRPTALEPLYAWLEQGHELVEALRIVGNAELGQASQRDRLTLWLSEMHEDINLVEESPLYMLNELFTEERQNH